MDFAWFDRMLGKEGIINTSDTPSALSFVASGGGGGGGYGGTTVTQSSTFHGGWSEIHKVHDPDKYRGMFPNSINIQQPPHETSKYEAENFIRMAIERLPEDSIEEMQKKELAFDAFKQLHKILSE